MKQTTHLHVVPSLGMCGAILYFPPSLPRLEDGHKFNPLNAELNPICHLLALLGGATIVVVSRLRVKYMFSCPRPEYIENAAI